MPTWEHANRQQILGIKQDAEQLAINGKYRAAYDKYQELERLVGGHTITDPYLQEELIRSWERRDSLYDLITAARSARGERDRSISGDGSVAGANPDSAGNRPTRDGTEPGPLQRAVSDDSTTRGDPDAATPTAAQASGPAPAGGTVGHPTHHRNHRRSDRRGH